MSTNRNMLLLGTVVLLGVMAARFLVHPLHARAEEIDREYAELLDRVDGWPGEEAVLAPIRNELDRRRAMDLHWRRAIERCFDLHAAPVVRNLKLYPNAAE